MKQTCPECGSSRVVADGDRTERLDTNGQLINTEFYGWWACQDCDYQFRYQDEALNPQH